jgi:tetratricopeptide (TPR) repeat protein
MPFYLLRLPIAAAAFALALAGAAFAAPADDLREAQKLYGQGRYQPAMEKIDAFLQAQPKDAQGRFLKGLLLTEQKKVAEAIQVFTGLTEDYPELSEPYNNLAVLYASIGNYDKARSALELATLTNPGYATAHENLGDIHAQLAARSYERAQQLDKNNSTAKAKLAMVKELFTAQKPGASATARIEPPKAAKAEPVRPDPAGAKPPAPVPAPDEKGAISAAIDAWAKAWSAKDAKAYLATYAPDFEPPSGLTRAAWEKKRTEQIQASRSIEVDVKIQSITVSGNQATAVFRQAYKSDDLKSNNRKTLKLVKVADKWLIRQERVGG